MKRMNLSEIQEVKGGLVGCTGVLLGCAFTFATAPTGIGTALLLMGGASLCIAGIATECKRAGRFSY